MCNYLIWLVHSSWQLMWGQTHSHCLRLAAISRIKLHLNIQGVYMFIFYRVFILGLFELVPAAVSVARLC